MLIIYSTFFKTSLWPIEGKKLTAIYDDEIKKSVKTVRFWKLLFFDDSVAPHDTERRNIYIERRKTSEGWVDCMTVGALSRYILWE